MRIFLLLILTAEILSQSADFTVKFIYPRQERDLILKLNTFSAELEKKLENYDWKFPHTDFNKIETSVSINIEKLISDNTFSGVMTVSSGLASEPGKPIALKKDIYYNEQGQTFKIMYEEDPQIETFNPTSVESIIMFYSYLTLGEIFDKLSYTDQKNFRLEGDYYFQKLYEFENFLISAADRNMWKKRLEIINKYRMNGNSDMRKLNAYIYNAVHLYNAGKKDRAVLFIEPITESMIGAEDLNEIFFMNNFFALGEIFGLSKDPAQLDFLISKDPAHENFYSSKKLKEKGN